MSTFNYLSNDVERNQVAQSYYTATGDISEAYLANDHNVAVDGLTIGIPLITTGNLGCTIFFRNTGADAAVKLVISPKASNKIVGSLTQAAAVFSASGTLGKDLENTKATALNGDWVALRAVSLTEWYIIGGQGIWISES
tara:strand:- start:263 stop:682 length:420 start_codon:yes stop_codon:yes gene_type:complete